MLSPDNETPAEVEPTEPVTPEAEPTAEEPPGEPSEADGEAPAGGEGAGDGAPEGQPDAADAEAKRKRAGGWQRRIERQERQIAQQAEVIERLSRQPAPAAAATPEAAKTAEQKGMELLRSAVKQTLAEEAEQQRQQTAVAEFQRRTAAVRAKHPDFDEVVASVSHIHVPQALTESLLTSEHGPAIMYQLAENPAELARISALPPIAAVREVGRLEVKLASGTPAPRNGAAPQRPAAPAPITPVTARGPTRVKRTEDMNQDEYNAWRDSQRKR